MANRIDPRPPLPEWILDAFEVLTTHTTDAEGDKDVQSIARNHAVDVLLTAEELALTSEDVSYALTRLLNRGYFYEVGNELRVTID